MRSLWKTSSRDFYFNKVIKAGCCVKNMYEREDKNQIRRYVRNFLMELPLFEKI